MLGHLFTVDIKVWALASVEPSIERPQAAPGPERNRRLSREEEILLLAAVDKHSNPMLRWIVRIAIETGMRSSEIVTLRRMQVDQTAHRASVLN